MAENDYEGKVFGDKSVFGNYHSHIDILTLDFGLLYNMYQFSVVYQK